MLMKTLGERLKHALKARGMSQAKLADKIDVSQQSIQYVCSGKTAKTGHAIAIATALNISPEWLQTGMGHMEFLVGNTIAMSKVASNIPLISWVQAGAWSEVSDLFQPGDADEFYPCPEKHSPNTFALKVVGESMWPDYVEGEIIFVDPEVEAINGSCVVVRQNGNTEATFKQLIIDGAEKYLKALNKDWPKQIIELLPDATVCGVVIGSYRKR